MLSQITDTFRTFSFSGRPLPPFRGRPAGCRATRKYANYQSGLAYLKGLKRIINTRQPYNTLVYA